MSSNALRLFGLTCQIMFRNLDSLSTSLEAAIEKIEQYAEHVRKFTLGFRRRRLHQNRPAPLCKFSSCSNSSSQSLTYGRVRLEVIMQLIPSFDYPIVLTDELLQQLSRACDVAEAHARGGGMEQALSFLAHLRLHIPQLVEASLQPLPSPIMRAIPVRDVQLGLWIDHCVPPAGPPPPPEVVAHSLESPVIQSAMRRLRSALPAAPTDDVRLLRPSRPYLSRKRGKFAPKCFPFKEICSSSSLRRKRSKLFSLAFVLEPTRSACLLPN
jgi:hypothetical protein